MSRSWNKGPNKGHTLRPTMVGCADSKKDSHVIDSPSDVAYRLRRTVREKKLVERYWAGWKLSMTFGPSAEAFGPERISLARQTASAILGKPWTEANSAQSMELERDEWHLSVSWRGTYPVADGKRLLDELIIALNVPEADRAGQQPIRTMRPGGALSPQVTHWIWRDIV